jgi:hypothetical protein
VTGVSSQVGTPSTSTRGSSIIGVMGSIVSTPTLVVSPLTVVLSEL